jgi:hypothetical protein
VNVVERTRQLPRWSRWLLGVAGIVTLLLSALALLLAASMSGGFDNLLDFRKPDADDRRVVRAGEAALEELAEDGAALAASMAQAEPSLGSALGGTGATVCDVGQHNWKIDDDYDLRCTARHVVAFAPAGQSSGEQLARVGEQLSSAGWNPVYPPRAPASVDGAQLRVGGQQVADYTRSDERLSIRLVGAKGFYAGDTRYTELPPLRGRDGTELPVADLPARTPPGHYTLVIEIERPYFEE